MLNGFVDNPCFMDKANCVTNTSSQEWKQQFEQWYETSKTTKMQKIKSDSIKILRNIMNKLKNKNNIERD